MLTNPEYAASPEFDQLRAVHAQLNTHTATLWRRDSSVVEVNAAKQGILAALALFESLSLSESITHAFLKRSAPFFEGDQHRPDILDVVELIPDVRLLVMVRNPMASSYSAFRRGFVENIRHAAIICEDQLSFLNARVATLAAEQYRVVHYEDFCLQPKNYLEDLAAFFNFDGFSADQLLSEFSISTQQNHLWQQELEKQDQVFLQNYFDPRRMHPLPSLGLFD